jgi:hypothetical protein
MTAFHLAAFEATDDRDLVGAAKLELATTCTPCAGGFACEQ